MPVRFPGALFLALASSVNCSGSGAGVLDAGSDARRLEEAGSDVPPACPLAPPTPGEVCSLPASFPCSFGDPCSFDRFACRSGRWVGVVIDGAAPEPCPAAAPSTGSTCASCGKSYRCDYLAPCGAATTSTCSGGHWLTGTGPCDAGVETGGSG